MQNTLLHLITQMCSTRCADVFNLSAFLKKQLSFVHSRQLGWNHHLLHRLKHRKNQIAYRKITRPLPPSPHPHPPPPIMFLTGFMMIYLFTICHAVDVKTVDVSLGLYGLIGRLLSRTDRCRYQIWYGVTSYLQIDHKISVFGRQSTRRKYTDSLGLNCADCIV